jgi:hypothetical protein
VNLIGCLKNLFAKNNDTIKVVIDAHEEKQTARETIETLEDQVVKLEERLKQEVFQNKHLEDEVNQLQTHGGLESSGAGGGGGGGNDSHLQLETKTTSDPSPRLSEVENNWESSENNSENIGDSFNEQQLRNELESLRASSVEQKKNALLAAESLRVSNEEDKKTALLAAEAQRKAQREELESLRVSNEEDKKTALLAAQLQREAQREQQEELEKLKQQHDEETKEKEKQHAAELQRQVQASTGVNDAEMEELREQNAREKEKNDAELKKMQPQGLKNNLKITVESKRDLCKLFYTFLSIQKIHQNRSHAFDTFHDRWQQTTDATTLTHHQPCWMSYTFFSSSLLLFEQPARLQR